MPFVEGGLVEDVPQSAPASGFVEGGLVEDPTPEDSYNIVRGFTSGTHDYIPTKKDFLQYEQVSSEKPYPWGQLPGAVAEMGKELVVGLPQKAAETVAEAVYQPSVADARAMLGATQAEVALRSAQRAKDIGMGLIDTILNQYDKATGATGEESDQKRYERFLARADIKRNLIRAQTGQHPSVDVQTMETLGIPTEAISQPGVQVGEFIAAPENIAFAGGGKLAGMALQAGGRALPSVGGAVRAAGEKIYNVAGFPERFAGSAATALTGSEAAGLRASQAVAAGSAALTGAELAGVEGISASIPVLPTLAKGISAGKAAGATLETLGEAAQVSGGPTLSAAQQFLLNAGERIAVAPGASEATKALGTFIARSGVEAPAVAAMKILIPAAGGGIAGGLFAGLTGEEKDAIVHATGGGIAFGALDSAFTLAKAAAAGSFKGQRVRAAAEADLNARPETAQFTFVDNLGNTTDSTLNDKASRAALYSKLDDAQLTKTLSEVANAEAAGTDVVFHDSSAQLPKGIDAISYKGVYIPPESIKSGRPTILINVDKVSPETLPHELVHARVTPDFIKEVSSNVLEGKIDQVQFTDFANKYANQLEAAGSKQLADNMRDELVQAFNPQNSRAQRIDAAKNIVNEFTSYYTQEWLAGKDAKKLLPGRIPAWYETAFNKAKEVVADKFSRRALQAGFDPVSRSFYDASGKRLRIPWMEDSIDKLVAKNQGFEGVDRKVDTRSLSRGEREALIQSKGWTDLYQLAPDGSIQRPLTGKEVATKTAEIAKKTTDVLEAMPKDKRSSKTALDDKGNPVIQGRLSPEEAKAISDSGIFSPSTSRFLIEMAKGMEEGNLYDSKYWKVYGRSGKAGVFGESSKTILPYAISINSKGGVNIKVVDWSKVQGRMQAALNKPQYKNLFRNYDDAYRTMRDVYLKNLADPLSQTASAEALGGGVEGNRKRNFFNEVMGAVPKVADVLINPATAGYQSNRKAGSVYVDLRIERIQDLVNNGEKIPWSGDMGESSSYRRTQLNWQPAEQIGDTIAKSDSVGGFRIISAGDKFRLYAPSGEKVGIFDTEGQAKLKAEKAYATNQRIQPEVGQQEYQPRNEGGQATEAGGRNRDVGGAQGGAESGQALGSVRQARDVRYMPMSDLERSDIDLRISTRNPSAKKATENPLTQQLSIDLESITRTPGALPEIISTVGKYPGIKFEKTGAMNRANEFIRFVANNLIYLHDNVPENVRNRSKLWYDGARQLTEDWSQKFNTTREGVAGVIASLSPQKDWYQNVTLAERVFDVVKTKQDEMFAGPIEQWARTKMTSGKTPKRLVQDEVINGMAGKKFSELSDYEKAVFVRAFDEVNNTRTYPIVSPEGKMLDIARKADGTPATYAWGDFNSIAKAVKIATNPTKKVISDSLGYEHKVRSFYDNILLPNNPEHGDVTIDTHAVAAALMLPLAGSDIPVAHNFGQGVPGSSVYGTSGTYGVYADAYRLAAKERGILPREMQSITWEAIRGLFTPEFKTAQNKKLIENIWKDYKSGKVSLDETRQRIVEAAGGIRNPSWYGSSGPTAAENAPSVNASQLSVPGDMGGSRTYSGGGIDVSKTSSPQINQPRFMPDQQGFYSKLEEVVSTKIPNSASPQQILATVDPAKGSGVKAEELKWTGFAQAVERIARENGGRVPKDKLLEHLRNEGAVRFEEITRRVEGKNITQEEIDRLERVAQRTRSDADWRAYEQAVIQFENQELGTEAKYSKYQIPGGENYKEVVLTSDISKPFTSSHFEDIPNYVAHMRLNERADKSGKSGLFVEEIQSDRHQKSRKIGYIEDKKSDWSQIPIYEYKDLVQKGIFPETVHIEHNGDIYKLVAPDGNTIDVDISLENLQRNYENRNITGVPDAPFRKDWSIQMFKRALRDAVASGKDWIGWTTGETQADRYNLRKSLSKVEVARADNDYFLINAYDKNGGEVISNKSATSETLPDILGEEFAAKIIAKPTGFHVFEGMDLELGGEGMKGFYDKILPSEVQKYVKQWGGEVKKSSIPEDQIWRVDITPKMRESIRTAGQPSFMPDASMPGAYTMTGGYRALPAKAKGKLRVYGPLGQLVGIASSLDEAQRMVQRKLR